MLTKDHLKFAVRSGRIKPFFIAPSDQATRALAEELLAIAQANVGVSAGELQDVLQGVSDIGVAAGLRKLILDRCELAEDDGQIGEARWRALAAAQELRSTAVGLPLQDFQARIGAELGQPFATLQLQLYADLPGARRVNEIPQQSAENLIDRYNCAQVQGLLLRARRVSVTTKKATLGEKRELFRQMKFHRLMADVVDQDGHLTVSLSGPLSLFDEATTYGMRLANFFPHVLNLTSWQVDADVQIKNRVLELRLDQKAGLRSHYRHHLPHIPPELLACVDALNQRSKDWQAAPGADFVHIGKESYCFPDLAFCHRTGKKVHLELFHRWHASTLLGRLQAVESLGVSNLVLGVHKKLAQSKELAPRLAESEWFGNHGIIFADFPTPKVLLEQLGREYHSE